MQSVFRLCYHKYYYIIVHQGQIALLVNLPELLRRIIYQQARSIFKSQVDLLLRN